MRGGSHSRHFEINPAFSTILTIYLSLTIYLFLSSRRTCGKGSRRPAIYIVCCVKIPGRVGSPAGVRTWIPSDRDICIRSRTNVVRRTRSRRYVTRICRKCVREIGFPNFRNYCYFKAISKGSRQSVKSILDLRCVNYGKPCKITTSAVIPIHIIS